ncbi:MAG: T9SS type A sorting domain-containing protein, partial [Bacteroidota bacterium]
STVITIKVNSCIGIEEQAKQVFNIYPNPSSGLIRIEAETETEITITNALGQHIKTLTLNAQNNFKANVSIQTKGLYFLKTKSLTEKLIIE